FIGSDRLTRPADLRRRNAWCFKSRGGKVGLHVCVAMARGERHRHVPFVVTKINSDVVSATTLDLHSGSDRVERADARLDELFSENLYLGLVIFVLGAHGDEILRSHR